MQGLAFVFVELDHTMGKSDEAYTIMTCAYYV